MRQPALSRQGAVRWRRWHGARRRRAASPGAAHAGAGKRCVSVLQQLAAGRGWYTRMDRLASRSFKDLNSAALRRKPTVMPDSTSPPGDPGVPRDTDRRASEQGAGAPRRTPSGAPAASGLVRSRAPRPGAVGRAERVEPRWRDIQWIDFTSESDSEETPAPDRKSTRRNSSHSRRSRMPSSA